MTKRDEGMLANGLDFVLDGLSRLDGDQRDLKYASLHVWAGVGLILKERLRREHWSLVVSDIKKIDLRKYYTGDLTTVNFGECIHRLTAICDVKLHPARHAALAKLQGMRNRAEHFVPVDTADAMKASCAATLHVVIDFIHEHLDPDNFDASNADLFRRITRRVEELDTYVADRMALLKPELDELRRSGANVLECRECHSEAAVIDDGVRCLMCRHAMSAEGAAWQWGDDHDAVPYDPKEIATEPDVVIACPRCDEAALAFIPGVTPEGRCFSCGVEWGPGQLNRCAECDNVVEGTELICGSCFTAKVDRE